MPATTPTSNIASASPRMRALPVVCALLATACSVPDHRSSGIATEQLLLGRPLGLPPLQTEPVTIDDAMSLDREMRAFLEQSVGKATQESLVLNRLIRGMRERGLLTLDYVVRDTQPARQTFHSMHGNCMSFTVLFVALARASGLAASYELVDVRPEWNADPSLTVIANHISALVDTPGREYVIDFDGPSSGSGYQRETIADQHALALFFSNLGAEAFLRDERALAFHYLREAIMLDRSVADPWVNLGLFYARNGLPDYAESAYLEALEVDRLQHSALTNLATLYDTMGRVELAREYEDRIRRYQRRNPFYHFALAKEAFEENRFEDAARSARRAIRLKRDEHEFHELLELARSELGEPERVLTDLSHARD